jgi:hypothetical protein
MTNPTPGPVAGFVNPSTYGTAPARFAAWHRCLHADLLQLP